MINNRLFSLLILSGMMISLTCKATEEICSVSLENATQELIPLVIEIKKFNKKTEIQKISLGSGALHKVELRIQTNTGAKDSIQKIFIGKQLILSSSVSIEPQSRSEKTNGFSGKEYYKYKLEKRAIEKRENTFDKFLGLFRKSSSNPGFNYGITRTRVTVG
ncbi:MAG: hypothetical protein WDZ41_04735 [Candidatus Babeliales bacterium]